MKRRSFLQACAAATLLPAYTAYIPLIMSMQRASIVVSTTSELTAALANAVSGDTIILRGGVYTNTTTYNVSPLRQTCFYINKSITLEAYPGERAVLTYVPGHPPLQDTSDYSTIVYITAPNVTLRGITVIGTHALGDLPIADTDVAISASGGASNVVLDHCTILAFGHSGFKPYSTGCSVLSCTIVGGGFTFRDHGIYLFTGSGHQVRNTLLSRCAGYGVHLYGAPQNVVIDNCLIDDNGNGGVLLGGNGGHVLTNSQLLNNRGYGGLVLWKPASVGNTIVGNSILGNSTDVILDYAVSPQTVQSNIYGTIWTNSDYAAWGQH